MTTLNPPFTLLSRQSFALLVVFAALLLTPPYLRAGADPAHFPSYRSISANVAFWEKIYSTYSVNTAIIHDQNDLSRIYGTVPLTNPDLPGARRLNDKSIEQAKARYADLLTGLSRKSRPESAEEKRIAALFGRGAAPSVFKQAAGTIRAQAGLKERFAEGVARSGAYLTELKNIFRRHNLPEDLAYLPHVESSFNPAAFSKFGAAGMWQFTHSTGKEFLTIDYIIDERRDPLISAEAAARFLKRNHLLLGSWPLALTAYNYGTAGMMRALEQEGSYEKIFSNYRQGYFKFASRNFYSEFLAAVNVAKRLEQTGGIDLMKPVDFVSVKLPGYADAAKLCAFLRLSQKTLREYNPALREPVFEGTKYIPKGYLLKLPLQFKNSAQLSQAPPAVFLAEQKQSRFYQVRPGDTAGAIARAHHIGVGDLIRANHLNDQGFIRVGQNLRIPPPAGKRETVRAAADTAPTIVLSEGKKAAPAAQVPVFKADSTVDGNLKVSGIKRKNSLVSGTIEVQPDESIGMLAGWLKATPESIRLSNNMPTEKDIHAGQHLVLEFLNVSIEHFETSRFDFHQETQEDFFNSYTVVGMTTYTVTQGDTLWDICHNKFGLPLWLLKKYNDGLDFTRLELSSDLRIPVLKEI